MFQSDRGKLVPVHEMAPSRKLAPPSGGTTLRFHNLRCTGAVLAASKARPWPNLV